MNLCLDMFKDGSHHANPYCGLFNLMMQASRLARMEQAWCRLGTGWYIASAPGEFIEPERLDQVKYHLMSAEPARCRGKVDGVHHNLLTSALYFEETGDQSGCRAFYASLLKTSLKSIRGDAGGKRIRSQLTWLWDLFVERKVRLLSNPALGFIPQHHWGPIMAERHTEGLLWHRQTVARTYSFALMTCKHLRREYTVPNAGAGQSPLSYS